MALRGPGFVSGALVVLVAGLSALGSQGVLQSGGSIPPTSLPRGFISPTALPRDTQPAYASTEDPNVLPASAHAGINLTNHGIISGTISPASYHGNTPLVQIDNQSVSVLGNGAFSASELASAMPYNVTAMLYGYDPSTHFVIVTPGNTTWTNFTLVPLPPLPLYNVTFVETGLPRSTNWSVALGGTVHSSNSSSINFQEPNGTLSFTVAYRAPYLPSPLNGTLTVDGIGQNVSVAYFAVYPVTFSESGLPPGSTWQVTLVLGSMHYGRPSQGMIVFLLRNGTYTYLIGGLSGWTTSNFSGSVEVNGSTVAVNVTWEQVTYAVNFTETGLPVGTLWTATFDGNARSGTGTLYFDRVPNGTNYAFSVGAVGGYTASPQSGTISVAGSSLSRSIVFTAKPGPLELRAWANQTLYGGDLTSCQNPNGSVTTTGNAWEVWTYSAVAWNGTPPYNFSWILPGHSVPYHGARLTVNYTYPESHPPSAEVTVTDSAGRSNSTTRSLPEPAIPRESYPACPVFLGLTQSGILALIAIAAVVVLAVITVALAWKRRKGSRNPPG